MPDGNLDVRVDCEAHNIAAVRSPCVKLSHLRGTQAVMQCVGATLSVCSVDTAAGLRRMVNFYFRV